MVFINTNTTINKEYGSHRIKCLLWKCRNVGKEVESLLVNLLVLACVYFEIIMQLQC